MANDSDVLNADVSRTSKASDMSPIVSVIVPCYKQAHFLSETLASVQSQTLKEWECLIIDDGSPDETESVAKSWVEKDGRFLYFRKENGGLANARNFGIVRARGRFIQFLDSDDVIMPNKFQLQVQRLSGCPAHSVSFCDWERGSENDIYTPPNPRHYLPPILGEVTSVYELAADWETRLSIPAHCFLINKVFFEQGVLFDETLASHEDWDCWMKIFIRAEKIIYSPEKLAIYRNHPESMTKNFEKMKQGFLNAIDLHLNNSSSNRELKAILRVKRAEVELIYRKFGLRQMFAGLLKILVRKIFK